LRQRFGGARLDYAAAFWGFEVRGNFGPTGVSRVVASLQLAGAAARADKPRGRAIHRYPRRAWYARGHGHGHGHVYEKLRKLLRTQHLTPERSRPTPPKGIPSPPALRRGRRKSPQPGSPPHRRKCQPPDVSARPSNRREKHGNGGKGRRFRRDEGRSRGLGRAEIRERRAKPRAEERGCARLPRLVLSAAAVYQPGRFW